jgi:hypothetical protein
MNSKPLRLVGVSNLRRRPRLASASQLIPEIFVPSHLPAAGGLMLYINPTYSLFVVLFSVLDRALATQILYFLS